MRLSASLLAVFCLFTAAQALSAERSFTILHTNDWQSRLLGFGPNNEFTPATVNDDDTVGGVARLATLLKQRRAAAGEQAVLLLDGGDFSMGTLFHTVTRELGGELRLMTELGYDAATLGNHEFDFRPAGLAAMIGAFFILDDPIFNGLAIALIFGILVSTLLTLVVIPVLYFVAYQHQHPRSPA